MLTAFISYGGPDEMFAATLNKTLKDAGIKTYFFPVDAKPGEKLHHLMRDGVNSYDKVIFICSKDSLNRPGVINELEETLQREAREGGKQILIPIALDSYVFKKWKPYIPGLKQTILDRVVGNFQKAKSDKENYLIACKKLIDILEGSLDVKFIKSKRTLILDSTGEHCKITLENTFIVYQEMKEIPYVGLASTGEIIPLSTSLGKINSVTVEGANKAIIVSLNTPLPINEIITHNLIIEHINAFTNSIENYSMQMASEREEIQVDIYFPNERPVKETYIRCYNKGRTYLYEGAIEISADRNHVKYLIPNPSSTTNYIVYWSW